MLNEYVRIVAAFSDPAIAAELKRYVVSERLPYHLLFVSSLLELKRGLADMKPALVLSSSTLGGDSICERLSLFSDLPVVVLGMPGNEQLAVETLKRGVSDYLIYDTEGDYLALLPVAIEKALSRFEIRERDARAAIEAAESISRLEEFTSTAAHDLKGLLHNNINLLEALKIESADIGAARFRELFEGLEANGRRMWQLVEDLLAYARVQHRSDTLEPVSLEELIEQILVEMCNLRSEKKAQVDFSALPLVLGDRLMLRLLFANLLRNALQYTRTGVTPLIKVSGVRIEEKKCYELRVEDNGTGFPPEDAEVIFREFERVDAALNPEGSGLGLAICRRIAQRLGGEIRAESQPGQGACFTVSLPLRRVVLP